MCLLLRTHITFRFCKAGNQQKMDKICFVFRILLVCGILLNACPKKEIFARENFEHHLTMEKNMKKRPTATDSIIPIDDFCYQWFMDVQTSI